MSKIRFRVRETKAKEASVQTGDLVLYHCLDCGYEEGILMQPKWVCPSCKGTGSPIPDSRGRLVID